MASLRSRVVVSGIWYIVYTTSPSPTLAHSLSFRFALLSFPVSLSLSPSVFSFSLLDVRMGLALLRLLLTTDALLYSTHRTALVSDLTTPRIHTSGTVLLVTLSTRSLDPAVSSRSASSRPHLSLSTYRVARIELLSRSSRSRTSWPARPRVPCLAFEKSRFLQSQSSRSMTTRLAISTFHTVAQPLSEVPAIRRDSPRHKPAPPALLNRHGPRLPAVRGLPGRYTWRPC